MKLIQHWGGCVIEIGDTVFYARLWDITNSANPESEIIVDIDKIVGSNKFYIEVGAMFDLRIVGRSGTLFTDISFRREFWTADELETAKMAAEKMSLNWMSGE